MKGIAMITTVTLNPAIDRTVIVDTFTFGAVNRVGSSREDMGGKGINVVRILRALGSDALATGFVGSRNISHVKALLARDEIPHDLVPVDAPTRINTKLLELQSRTTTDINEAGFSVSQTEMTELNDRIRHYATLSDFVVFSGSVPKDVPASIYRDLIEQVSNQSKAVLDADGELLMNGLAAHPYLIKPNIHELENALGRRLATHTAIVKAARELIEQYQIVHVLISMGGDGAILVNRDQALHAAPLKVDVKGTVGAGDSMLAGFVHSLAEGRTTHEALACATACGALAVSKEGTEAFSRNEVVELAAKVDIQPIEI